MEFEALFGTFKGLKPRTKPYFPRYLYDILGRTFGILFSMFAILILLSFIAFAVKPFNITLTDVVEMFWRDYTFILSIPLTLPSFIKSIVQMRHTKDKIFYQMCAIYFVIITLINVLLVLYGTIPILKLLGA